MLNTGFFAVSIHLLLKKSRRQNIKPFPLTARNLPATEMQSWGWVLQVPGVFWPQSLRAGTSPKGNSALLTGSSPRVGLGWNAEPPWLQEEKGRERGQQKSLASSAGQLCGDELKLFMERGGFDTGTCQFSFLTN